MTNRIDRLEERGLVERVADPNDRRGVQVHLTRTGLALIDEGILDSFGLHEVLFFLENEFAISIADEEVLSGNFGSISAITAFVQRKMQGG